ncbi:MAG: PE-PGRS family protein [Acidobacteria bacterium]|nr:PE-PGRS family protein [Acidobacteriota bacterium]
MAVRAGAGERDRGGDGQGPAGQRAGAGRDDGVEAGLADRTDGASPVCGGERTEADGIEVR